MRDASYNPTSNDHVPSSDSLKDSVPKDSAPKKAMPPCPDLVVATADDLMLRDYLIEIVDAEGLPVTSPHACAYLEDQLTQSVGFAADQLHSDTYQQVMQRGYRRSGSVFYKPRCPACSACVPMRVLVDSFKPSQSQRRAVRRNQDLHVRVGPPDLTDEKVDLYQRYLDRQHAGTTQSADSEGLFDFLYKPVVATLEVSYRDEAGALVGVSIVDQTSEALSSVYHFFDPAQGKRSLGVYSVVYEIELTRQWGLPHYYLGYWIAGCKTMDYKAKYQPHEVLVDGQWRRA